MDREAGERVGEYILEAPLGEGGFGSVWRAHHSLLPEKSVAIKFPHPDTAEWLRREGLLQSKLRHERLVAVLGGELDGRDPYVVLELVEGKNLRQTLEEGLLTIGRAREVARGVLEGLAVAHSAGLAHGDLKPENVLLDLAGGVKLSDFGLAQSFLGEELKNSLINSRGSVAGTMRYLPPEMLERGGHPTAKSDVYAFGVLLFEMLVGRVPQGVESLQDHGVQDPDLNELFLSCYAPESRRLETAVDALEAFLRSIRPKGVLIKRRAQPSSAKKPSSGWFSWLFGRSAEEQSPAPAPAPTAQVTKPRKKEVRRPRVARRRVLPPAKCLEQIGAFSELARVSCRKGEQGEWLWEDLEHYLAHAKGDSVLALDLSWCRALTDQALAPAAGLVELQSLNLSGCIRVTDAGLASVAQLEALTHLSLRSCTGLTDAGVVHLRELRRLSSLDLSGCGALTDRSLSKLRDLTSLSFLFLDGCAVSSNTLKQLRNLPNIRWISPMP